MLQDTTVSKIDQLSEKINAIANTVQMQDGLATQWADMLTVEASMEQEVRDIKALINDAEKAHADAKEVALAEERIATALDVLNSQMEHIKATRKNYKHDQVYAHAYKAKEEVMAIVDEIIAPEYKVLCDLRDEKLAAEHVLNEYRKKDMSTKEARTAKAAYNMMLH